MPRRKLSESEQRYLKALPAVDSVTANRITYSSAFREECRRRYAAGDSPVEIFRDAGLDPKIIGYKRIERCVARWRDEDAVDTVTGTSDGFGQSGPFSDGI